MIARDISKEAIQAQPVQHKKGMSSAPSSVVESEKKKEQDALSTIDILTKKIADLG